MYPIQEVDTVERCSFSPYSQQYPIYPQGLKCIYNFVALLALHGTLGLFYILICNLLHESLKNDYEVKVLLLYYSHDSILQLALLFATLVGKSGVKLTVRSTEAALLLRRPCVASGGCNVEA